MQQTNLAVKPCAVVRKAAIGELGEAGTARRRAHGGGYNPLFHQFKRRQNDLAVVPCLSAREAMIGEHTEAGTARFFMAKS